MGFGFNTISFRGELCDGCGDCMSVCAEAKTQPRLRILPGLADGPAAELALCRQCGSPECATVCPAGALAKHPVTGVVEWDDQRCVNCLLCTAGCAYGGIIYEATSGHVAKCDTCDGDPACVRACPTGALQWRTAAALYNAHGAREDLFAPGLAACQGCHSELLIRHTLRKVGPEVVVAAPPGCIPGMGTVGYNGRTGAKVPIFHPLLTNTASMLAGMQRQFRRQGRQVTALALAGDGGTADAGFQSLSGAASRNDPILFICVDNEGYMNTGMQASGSTPLGSWTSTTPVGPALHGKQEEAKNLPLVMMMHNPAYVATASTAFLEDYYAKLEKAIEVSRTGFAYLHVYAPCPSGWRFPTSMTTEVARLGVETNFHPLWEFTPAAGIRFTRPVDRPRPVTDYVSGIGKYKHLSVEEIAMIQHHVDERLAALGRYAGVAATPSSPGLPPTSPATLPSSWPGLSGPPVAAGNGTGGPDEPGGGHDEEPGHDAGVSHDECEVGTMSAPAIITPPYRFQPEIETLSRDALSVLQLDRLRAIVRRTYDQVAPYRAKCDASGVRPEDLRSLDDLAAFPFSLKSDLRDAYPFGLFAVPRTQILRLHASSGTTGRPTVVGYTRGDLDTWAELMARCLATGGARPDDLIHNAYGYGLFTGGLGFHDGVERLGATVVPASGGGTERQIVLLRDFAATVLCATPSYALNIAEVAEREGVDLRGGPLRLGMFGAEPWSDGMRAELQARLGIAARDTYGLSEVLGPGVAAECEASDGLHGWEDHFLFETVDAETGARLPDGSAGELVITTLTKEALPMIRYRTRDITRLERARCACGRSHVRIMRITGRSDDMIILRGVNIYPTQVEAALVDVPGVSPHYQLVLETIGTMDRMTVEVEADPVIDPSVYPDLEAEVGHRIKSLIGITAGVLVREFGALPRSLGKAIRVRDLRRKA
jgi:phenylacetate-coenzyme A ligase PaaK-like adenylate-forming protein/pyruvate/2-oxoacid:ferredoxin oxidoreductase beta subunit/Fe-S-cluster-containing hydrogenase component 2